MFDTATNAESAFYRSFQDLDLPLMEQVWSEAPAIFCVHPGGGLLQGKPMVMQSWRDIFTGAKRPSMVHHVLQTVTHGELAIHLVEELIRPSGNPDSEPTRVLSTNIYRQDNDGWHMLSHHASLPLMPSAGKSTAGRLH